MNQVAILQHIEVSKTDNEQKIYFISNLRKAWIKLELQKIISGRKNKMIQSSLSIK